MSEVHPEFGKLMTAEEYAKEWEDNASHFQRYGYYSMPLQRLGGPRTVMEVGCGAGRSTLALAKKGHTVIAVEINEPAAQRACEYLSRNGITAQMTHALPSSLQDAPDAPRVTIVVGDVHADGFLEPAGGLGLDAVLCWFIGAQLDVIADFQGKRGPELTSDDVRDYRLSLQARCYEIGRQVLRDRGIVQIVDRMRLQSWQDKDLARDEQAHIQAKIAGRGYEISRASTFLSKIAGGFEASGIQYLTQLPDAQVRVVTSVIATLASRQA